MAAFVKDLLYDVLNQWRNIAQHLSISFSDEQIICSYGRSKSRRELTINKDMLFQVTQKVFMVHRCLKLASSLFGIDNLEEMIDNGIIPIDNLNIRSEARILNMVSAIASQGFEVVEFQTDEKNAKLIIQDVSKLDPELRRFHASQFIEELWLNTNSSSVTVDYLEHDGTPNLRTQASADSFERALKSDEPMKTIAAEVEMFDLKTNKIIPKLVDKTVKKDS